jgi:hypothetical protein
MNKSNDKWVYLTNAHLGFGVRVDFGRARNYAVRHKWYFVRIGKKGKDHRTWKIQKKI